ncbi:aminotransferase [Schumannella luteola]|uniref:4-aminobutyrate aminotransferase-like enzyme/Ser/Thr protein kinase RdoA (MazF antagonist) n=1 Tax=Schumannella luteola TaxID=472059 RepID=A0A852Y8U0_9MICO|nr:aminotransferase [Schumannella luteola]NYG97641.1 4-aminobutyrate aminotransferase-like enzyme/Ser/Thr protein kinase RdoA (MazF antagonist) [Schumannella luteola]TPX04691.1 aminotransferase [Schumannella luteola]
MSTPLFDYFAHVELATPTISAEEAERLLRSEFGLDARVESLGSQQDQNFLVWASDAADVGDAAHPLGVLKLSNPVFSDAEIELQTLAAERVASATPELRIPRLVRGPAGDCAGWWETSQGRLNARVIEFVAGSTLTGSDYLNPRTAARMGELAARVQLALAGLEHPASARVLQWDLRHATRVIETLAPAEPDETVRAEVLAATRDAAVALAPLADRLPRQLGHFDVTDDNILRPDAPGALPDAIIDFGDVLDSWSIGELATTVSSLLHHDGATPLSALPAIRAFHELSPLSDDEADALWPLVVLRGAVLVLSGRAQVRLDDDNAYASGALDREHRILSQALSVPLPVMARTIRHALGLPLAPAPGWPAAELFSLVPPGEAVVVLDAGTTGALNDRGAFTHDGALLRGIAAAVRDGRADAASAAGSSCGMSGGATGGASAIGARARASAVGAVLVPAGRPRLAGAPLRTPNAPATAPTGALLWLSRNLVLRDLPEHIVARAVPGAIELTTGGVTLSLASAALGAPAAAAPAGAGDAADPVGSPVITDSGDAAPVAADDLVVPGGEVTATLCWADASASIPALVEPGYLVGWGALVGDPTTAFALAEPVRARLDELAATSASARDATTLDRREHVLAEVQEHYYARPPQIERGWRELLVDTDARVYLDMVNNVTSVGHAHPRITAAASRQFELLNTNSRFNYDAIVDYGERVAATLPDELDTVFFVNSGSEATDLAIRLAMAATGRRDVIAMREAYHGWTYASDAVSTSIADNPNALATRPDWVHTVDAANSFRGTHRASDAVRYAPEAVERIRQIAASGHAPAGFIAETYFGNAGGVALPDGYLREVYAAVRAEGGLAIADEVQVGFGRLGEWFWGFEQQDVVPDIVAVAKSVGNGHPIGIVVTSKAVADRYRTGGYFFSSTGGSPVSSVIGMTVLDIIQSEGLQENARVVGAHLASRLRALASTHEIVGPVHGSDLYLGLEFVRSRETLEPATEETAAICDRLLELGVIMQPTGDFQNVLKIKPPLCLTPESADYFVDMLDRVLTTGW